MVALAFVGPVLFSLSGVARVGRPERRRDKFVEQAPAKEQAGARAGGGRSPRRRQGSAEQTASGTTTTAVDDLHDDDHASVDDHHRRGRPSRPRARRGMTSPATCSTTPSLLQVGSLMRFVGLLSPGLRPDLHPALGMRTGPAHPVLGDARAGPRRVAAPAFPSGSSAWFSGSRLVGLMLARLVAGPAAAGLGRGRGDPVAEPRRRSGPPPEERGHAGTVEGSGREISEQSLPRTAGAGEASARARRDARASAARSGSVAKLAPCQRLVGARGAAISSTRWPPGAMAKARSAPQSWRVSSTWKPASRSRCLASA